MIMKRSETPPRTNRNHLGRGFGNAQRVTLVPELQTNNQKSLNNDFIPDVFKDIVFFETNDSYKNRLRKIVLEYLSGLDPNLCQDRNNAFHSNSRSWLSFIRNIHKGSGEKSAEDSGD